MTDLLPLLDIPDETTIMRDTLVALSEAFHPQGIFWRQNVGQAWMGKSIRADHPMTARLQTGDVVIRRAQRVKFGAPGQSDLMGCIHGRFVAPEIKTETGTQRKAQHDWEVAVNRAGGLYFIARSPQYAVDLLRSTIADQGWDK